MPNDATRYLSQELLEVQRTLGWMDLVIGSISDAVYVTDSDSRFVFVNHYFSDLLGIPRIFLLGKIMDEVFTLKSLSQVPNEYNEESNKKSASGSSIGGIYEWVDADARKYIFRITTKQLAAKQQTVFLAQDITREYELSRMKTEFINLASHQLRTPMTAIMTYAHMLRDGYAGNLGKKNQELAETVVRSSERMINLVNDLLFITRIQNDSSKIDKAPVSIDQVFTRLHTELDPRIINKKILYKISLPSKPSLICGDSAILHEIFSNLVVNAIQYTPEHGKINVVVKNAGSKVKVIIKDTGIGIPKEHQPRMFNQFSRADNALVAYPEGTGLGLYVIKILLDKAGGTISFKSELGKGSAFTVTLPTK